MAMEEMKMKKITVEDIIAVFRGPDWHCDFESDPDNITYNLYVTEDGEIGGDGLGEWFESSMRIDDFTHIYDVEDCISMDNDDEDDELCEILASDGHANFDADVLRRALKEVPILADELLYYARHGYYEWDTPNDTRFYLSPLDKDILYMERGDSYYTGIITGCHVDFGTRLVEMETKPSDEFIEICEDLADQANAWLEENAGKQDEE